MSLNDFVLYFYFMLDLFNMVIVLFSYVNKNMSSKQVLQVVPTFLCVFISLLLHILYITIWYYKHKQCYSSITRIQITKQTSLTRPSKVSEKYKLSRLLNVLICYITSHIRKKKRLKMLNRILSIKTF